MKRLHRKDLFTWSWYYEPLHIDFNGFLWQRPEGNVLIDPVQLAPHDEKHLAELGGAAWVLLTNSDHLRATRELVGRTGAKVMGPAAERERFPIGCDRWLADGDEPFPGLLVRALDGSKTDGELALVLDETTVLFGDLVRSHRADTLVLLRPEQGLRDEASARASVRRLLELHPRVEHVLVGDGWFTFRHARTLLAPLVR